jgi:pyruvate dehydrogenase E2 component (dihydrolipoamide acetyltransferase)
LCKAIALSLLKFPRLNAHLIDQEIREFKGVDLGVAVALEEGLVVPVLRGVELKGLLEIQSELSDLANRARQRQLKPEEMKNSTFTLSNLGMYEIEEFTSILNPPEVGILSAGSVQETPMGIEGQIVLRPTMKVTLGADHRAVDGAMAAQFLRYLKELLENPFALVLESVNH